MLQIGNYFTVPDINPKCKIMTLLRAFMSHAFMPWFWIGNEEKDRKIGSFLQENKYPAFLKTEQTI